MQLIWKMLLYIPLLIGGKWISAKFLITILATQEEDQMGGIFLKFTYLNQMKVL